MRSLLRAPTFIVAAGRAFELASPMVYRWDAKDILVTVPVGFVTDFASIPRPIRNLIDVNGKHRLPAVLHDRLYALGGKLADVRYTRQDADDEFLRAMKEAGVSWVTRTLMHRAVRMFGGFHRSARGGRTWA